MDLRCLVLRTAINSKTSVFSFIKAKNSIPNVILYGKLGRYPINIVVKLRMIGLWQRIVNSKPKILSKILLAMYEKNFFHSK